MTGLRILLATDLYAPSTGGIERHVASLAGRLGAAGHHAVVVTTTRSLPAVDGVDANTKVDVRRIGSASDRLIRRRARPEQHFLPPVPDPVVVRAIRDRCRTEVIDVIHAHGWMAHSAVRAGRAAGVPVVVSLHDYGLDCARRSRVRSDGSACTGASTATCLRCAAASYGPVRGPMLVAGLVASRGWWPDVAAFVANSEAVADAARESGISCTVVSPWLAPTGSVGAPVPGLPEHPFALYVGALAEHKGVGVLSEAWRVRPPCPLVVLGSRPEANAPALPDRALVHLEVDHRQVLGTMARAAITVVPSTYAEPFGLVAAEAMWAGSVVVASAAGGLVDVLEGGRSGVLVPPGSPDALRAAVAGLLADPDRRAVLVRRAQERVARLDGLDPLLHVYEQALPPSLRT